MKVFLYFIGKPKDTHANSMAEDFVARAFIGETEFVFVSLTSRRTNLPTTWTWFFTVTLTFRETNG